MHWRYSGRSEGRRRLPQGVGVVSGPATTAPLHPKRGRVAAAGTLRAVLLLAAPPMPRGSARGRPPARGQRVQPQRPLLDLEVREEAGEEGEEGVMVEEEQGDQEGGEGARRLLPTGPSAQGSNANAVPSLRKGDPAGSL